MVGDLDAGLAGDDQRHVDRTQQRGAHDGRLVRVERGQDGGGGLAGRAEGDGAEAGVDPLVHLALDGGRDGGGGDLDIGLDAVGIVEDDVAELDGAGAFDEC